METSITDEKKSSLNTLQDRCQQLYFFTYKSDTHFFEVLDEHVLNNLDLCLSECDIQVFHHHTAKDRDNGFANIVDQ